MGRECYYIIKNIVKVNKSELLQDIPSGFEFYEFPFDARVVIRKVIKSPISFSEIEIVNEVMKGREAINDYIIDKKVNGIMIYTARLNVNNFPELKENFWCKPIMQN